MSEKSLATLAAVVVVGIVGGLAIGELVVGEDKIERACGLPPLPEPWYAALGLPAPTDREGKAEGDCLPLDDAERLLARARLAVAVLPKWRDLGLKPDACAAWVLAVESKSGNTEEIFKVCGPPPEKDTEAVEKLGSIVQGGSVRVLSDLGSYTAKVGEKPLAATARDAWTVAELDLLPCACRPTADRNGLCQVGGKAAPMKVTLTAGTWSGSCARKSCSEAQEVADRAGRGYSMPVECL